MKPTTLFTSVLTILSLGAAPWATAADLPSVDSILAKHVDAIGGKEAIEKVTSRVVKFKIESEALGPSEGTLYAKGPNKQRSEITLADQNSVNEGYDGVVAWAKNPWQGLRVKSGDELAKVKRDTDIHRELKLKSLYPGLACVGTEKVGDEEAYVLESKPSATSKERFFYSTKSSLLLRQESQYEGDQGVVNVTSQPKDYRTVDGVNFPGQMKLAFTAGGQSFEFTMKFVEVTHNVKIDDAKFTKPAE